MIQKPPFVHLTAASMFPPRATPSCLWCSLPPAPSCHSYILFCDFMLFYLWFSNLE